MKEARVVRTMRRERRGKSNSQIKLWHSIRRGSNLKNRGMKSLLGNCLIEARERGGEKFCKPQAPAHKKGVSNR